MRSMEKCQLQSVNSYTGSYTPQMVNDIDYLHHVSLSALAL